MTTKQEIDNKVTSIREKLTRINTYKSQIESSIENKGVDIPVGTALREYPSKIDDITGSGGSEGVNLKLVLQQGMYNYQDVFSSVETVRSWACCMQNITSVSAPICSFIGGHAFSGCTSLSYVSAPSVTTIESAAFYWCSSLTTVYMPNVVSMSSWAFLNCTNLTNITLTSLSMVDYYGLYNVGANSISLPNCFSLSSCAIYGSNLSAVYLGNVQRIVSSYAISGANVRSIYIQGSSATLYTSSAFYGTKIWNWIRYTPSSQYSMVTFDRYAWIYVPDEYVSLYKSATNWTYYSSRISGYSVYEVYGYPEGYTADLESKLASLQATNAELTSQLSTITANNESLQSDVDTLTANNESLQSNVDTLNTNIDTLTDENAALTSSNESLTNSNETLTSENATLQSDIDALNTEISTLNTDVTNIQSSIDNAYSDYDNIDEDKLDDIIGDES